MAMKKLYAWRPAAMLYVSMRGESSEIEGWGRDVPVSLRPLTDEWMEQARVSVLDAMARVRQESPPPTRATWKSASGAGPKTRAA